LIYGVNGFAQEFKYNFRNISVKDGLSHSDVTSVVQDQQGFLWIGTLAGINKYDGYELKGFSNKKFLLESVFKNRINKLKLNKDLIWLATEGGIDCFNIKKEEYVAITWELKSKTFKISNKVLSLFILPKNKLIVSTLKGLYVFQVIKEADGIVLKEIVVKNNRFKNGFIDIQTDNRGVHWLLTQRELFVLKESEKKVDFKKVNLIASDKKVNVYFGFYVKDDKNLFVGVENGFLKATKKNINNSNPTLSATFYEIKNPLVKKQNKSNSRFTINSFEKGINNSIWLGSSYGLIECIQEKGSFDYNFYNRDKDNLSRSGVLSLFKDKAGCLWMSNYEGGLNYTDLYQKKFYSLTYDNASTNSLPESYVRAITEDNIGNIWIGTEKSGLCYYNFKTSKFTHYKHFDNDPNSVSSDGIRSLLIDSNNRLWVGTVDGISIYLKDKNRFFNITSNGPINKSITNDVIFSLSEDKFGNIWAGSWQNGLNRINFKDEFNYKIEKIDEFNRSMYGLSSSIITFILADKNDPDVFVGTDKGLNRIFLYPDGTIKSIKNYSGNQSQKNSLSSNFVWPIIRENDSILWVGTLGGGLNKVTFIKNFKLGYKAKVYSTDQGAPSNDIESILYNDKEKNLWIGGAGLSKFEIADKQFVNYDHDDGLVGNSFKVGSAHKGNSGRFYFGSTDGLTFFYPSQIKTNSYPSRIILTDLVINNKPVQVSNQDDEKPVIEKAIQFVEEITLNHLQNNFQIYFSSDHFVNPNKVKFKYKLIGYDKDWVFVGAKNRKASFTNLAYGDYVFQVTCTNSDGEWTRDIKTLRISVLAPWWYTQWAKLGYFVLFIVFLVIGFLAIVRWFKLKKAYEISIIEEKQKEELYQLRAQFFTNISHEFKTPLTLIFNPLEKLINKDITSENQRNAYYQLMFKNAKRLLKLINELIDYRKVSVNAYKLDIENNDLVDFIKDIEGYFGTTIKKKTVHFLFENNLKSSQLQFDKTVLEKIFFNIVGNALKFISDSGNISITISDAPFLEDKKYSNKIVLDSDFEADKYIYISIEDNGMGIDSEKINHIFDGFFQGNKNTDPLSGSGIGLTLVKSLVELHKAKLTVLSEPNVGAKFVLELPDIDYFTVFPELLTNSSVKLSGKPFSTFESPIEEIKVNKINFDIDYNKPILLLVEDNEELRDFIRDDFQEDYLILEASNGEEALELLQMNNIQLIISDITMPKMDGIELCKKVKESSLYNRIPFILLTAKYKIENQIEGMQSGADIYIPKPFSLDVLKLNVFNILKSRKELKEMIVVNTFEEARKVTSENSDDKFIKLLMDTIDENIEDVNFDVEKLSKLLGYSKSSLYTAVKSITSESIGSMIRTIRLKKAAQILSSSDLSIIQVMEKVGMQSQSHFTKSFKKQFGVNPSEFKAGLK
jgi:signal transduction histidine kinase/ligand-binding sensor domain-containing protein/DNA-binding response OmpR family regulator